MRKFKQKAALILTTAAMLAGSVVVSSPANAASSPVAACGGGSYHVIDQHAIKGATLYLMYNGSTNCAVAWKTANVGTPTYMDVWIMKHGASGDVEDGGNYSYYAGPVKMYAPGTCIRWGGSHHPDFVDWYSDWSHCG